MDHNHAKESPAVSISAATKSLNLPTISRPERSRQSRIAEAEKHYVSCTGSGYLAVIDLKLFEPLGELQYMVITRLLVAQVVTSKLRPWHRRCLGIAPSNGV